MIIKQYLYLWDTLNWFNIDDTLYIPNYTLHLIVSRVNMGKLILFLWNVLKPSKAFRSIYIMYKYIYIVCQEDNIHTQCPFEFHFIFSLNFLVFFSEPKARNFWHVDRTSSISLKQLSIICRNRTIMINWFWFRKSD